MEINYFGHQCIEIKQKGIIALLDPYEPTGQIAHPRAKAHLVTVSTAATPDVTRKEVAGVDTPRAFVVDAPGGYELKGVLIDGIASYADGEKGTLRGPNTIFALRLSSMNILHCGMLGHTLTADDIEEIGNVDILFISVGDEGVDAKTASKIVDQIEPRIVIPMTGDDGVLADFIKEVGETAETLDTLKLEAKDLPSDGQRLVVLKAQ
ncbi:MAG: MBL fold metallo-hydrolase [Patescibacteria group bacterium]